MLHDKLEHDDIGNRDQLGITVLVRDEDLISGSDRSV